MTLRGVQGPEPLKKPKGRHLEGSQLDKIQGKVTNQNTRQTIRKTQGEDTEEDFPIMTTLNKKGTLTCGCPGVRVDFRGGLRPWIRGCCLWCSTPGVSTWRRGRGDGSPWVSRAPRPSSGRGSQSGRRRGSRRACCIGPPRINRTQLH